MNDLTAPVIDKSVLRGLTLVGKGGQGTVWATDSVRLNGSWPAVYKEYDRAVLAGLNAGLLHRMVAFVPGLQYSVGQWLCEQAAWPAALVRENGDVRGFLMRRIPPAFEIRLPQRGGVQQSKPAGLQYLLNPDDYLARMAIPVDDSRRLSLLANLAGTLSELHRLGIVLGDLSPNNLLFQLSDEPRCFFIDCDAMRLHGRSVLKQTETPDWEVPSGEELATPASDAYKFGLLAIRLFARDQSSRDGSVLASLSPKLGELAERSQAEDPAARPTPAEWVPALQAVTRTGGAPQPAPSPSPPPSSPASPPVKGGTSFGTVVVALLVLLCVIGLIAKQCGSSGQSSGMPQAGTEATTTPEVTAPGKVANTEPAAAPTVGIVAYDPVAKDPAGARVAQMFATYFGAVNRSDWATALRLYDPDGVVDNTDATQQAAFQDAMSTTRDSNASLLTVAPSGTDTLARLTFISAQSPGFGPPRDRNEPCTRWNILYRLTYSDVTGYRILKPEQADSAPC